MDDKRQHGTMTFEEVTFEKIHAKIKEERYDNMKNIFEKGARAQKKFGEKNTAKYEAGDHGLLKRHTDKKNSSYSLQEQMVETKAWKKLRGIEDQIRSRLSKTQTETVENLLARYNRLAGKEYTRQHSNVLMMSTVQWCIQESIIPEGVTRYEPNKATKR